ncbi:SLC13 family permease [Fodinicola acaciae]|uniref:SLC13 family permease n=1 Tax=Fodinicola acaciae TaxID=2681555 RepID=UPI001FEAD075|nr:ArsB/NhaD family transporter [Fodinicola acaciae]
MPTIAAILLLGLTLAGATAGHRRVPEAAVAVPAAVLAVVFGLVTAGQAWSEVVRLGPTVGFLAAILVLAHLCDREGVFSWAGAWMAHSSTARPRRLLVVVFAVASATTAVLSLDATVVLLTPVVVATAARLRVPARPHVYACGHLANSASLLLPVSNLTNLLAYHDSRLSFLAFAALMTVPWLAVIATEYTLIRLFFASDLKSSASATTVIDAKQPPVVALTVLGACLAGFAVAGPLGIDPAVVAAIGAVVLAVRQVWMRSESRRVPTLWRILRETNPLFCLFVFALAIVVAAVSSHGLGGVLTAVFPSGDGFVDLLVAAGIAALLANLVNNLPATLLLVPVAAGRPELLLAVLLGVNIGPNLTYVGSLATLLWRRVLRRHGTAPSTAEFLRLGAATVPASLLAGLIALWVSLQLAALAGLPLSE